MPRCLNYVCTAYLPCFDEYQRQEQLQSSRLGQTLQSSYTDSYLGYNTSDDALELTRAVVRSAADA